MAEAVGQGGDAGRGEAGGRGEQRAPRLEVRREVVGQWRPGGPDLQVGRVIHPVLAAGQIEGGVAQGIGWALYENVVWQGGRMANGQMTNYIIPTSADIPPIRVHFFENPYAGGPGGAKGIGELPMDGPAPAILNAVEHATGLSFTHVPLTPEAVMEALDREAVARP